MSDHEQGKDSTVGEDLVRLEDAISELITYTAKLIDAISSLAQHSAMLRNTGDTVIGRPVEYKHEIRTVLCPIESVQEPSVDDSTEPDQTPPS